MKLMLFVSACLSMFTACGQSKGNKTAAVEVEPENAYFSNDFDASLCSFYDKFDGNTLDTSKWVFQNGTGAEYGLNGWGNNEAQYYQPQNAVVRDGVLRLEVKREPAGGKKYTSAKLVTHDSRSGVQTFTQKYGRFEAKIRLTKAEQGIWPAFWMMPRNSTYGGWPRSGEIDIMEMKGRRPANASSTVHFLAKSGTGERHRYRGSEYRFPDDKDFTDWHVYGLHWTEDEIIFLIDGMQHRRMPASTWRSDLHDAGSLYPTDAAPFDQDFYMILNLAVGGNFDGNRLPADDALPIALEIDWVRCYTLENNPWEITGTLSPFSVHNYQN